MAAWKPGLEALCVWTVCVWGGEFYVYGLYVCLWGSSMCMNCVCVCVCMGEFCVCKAGCIL